MSSRNLFPPLDKMKGVHREITFWQYYDTGFVGKLHRWIFRARYRALHATLSKLGVQPRHALDIGCGGMLLGFGILTKFDSEYVGLDILPSIKLGKYADLISRSAGKRVQVIRGSAENIPFREGFFDLITAFDVLEHLDNPKAALIECSRVITREGLFVVSLPLENSLHRLTRIFGGALIGTPWRIGKRPNYHYAGEVSSYEEMVKCLGENFTVFKCVYTPIGFASLININGILFCHAKVSLSQKS